MYTPHTYWRVIFFFLFQKDTEIYQNAKILEDFFEQLLEKWLTDYAFDAMDAEDEPDTPEPKKKKKLKEADPVLHIHWKSFSGWWWCEVKYVVFPGWYQLYCVWFPVTLLAYMFWVTTTRCSDRQLCTSVMSKLIPSITEDQTAEIWDELTLCGEYYGYVMHSASS